MSATLTVGSGKQYATIQAAVNAARGTVTIDIDAGTYNEQITMAALGAVSIAPVAASTMVAGTQYTIAAVGTGVNWTDIGFSAGTVGTAGIYNGATRAGTGGTVTALVRGTQYTITSAGTGSNWTSLGFGAATVGTLGTYNGTTVPAGTGTATPSGRKVTLAGAGIDSTIINAPSGSNGVWISGPSASNNITIQNLTINGSDNSNFAIEKAALYFSGAMGAVSVSNCKVKANGEYAILTSGVVASSFSISGCTIVGKTFTGSAPATKTWTGTYFGGGQFTQANVPRQLITINSGTYGTAIFSNNTVGDADSATGGAVTGDNESATHRANTVMTCDANFAISGNTFDVKCFPFVTGAYALRVRGAGASVSNNTFKDLVNNGLHADNLAIGNTAAVTYSKNVLDFTSASTSSGYSMVGSSYVGGTTTRLCWSVFGGGLPSAVNVYGLGSVIASDNTSHMVYPAAGSHTFASAILAAGTGHTIQAGPVDLTEALIINKSNLTIFGAVDGAGAPTTQIGGANWYSLHVNNSSNISVSNIQVKSPQSSATHYMMHLDGSAAGASNILLTNVKFDNVSTRGISVNSASNVTLTNCVLPLTGNYTLGLASVKGITLTGCTIPASAWGSVGVFTTEVQAVTDKSTSAIDLSNNTWTNSVFAGVGIVNIQPASYASYKLAGASGSAAVTLPAAFEFAYLEQVRSAAGADLGSENVQISNSRIFGQSLAYNALQSAVAPNRIAMYGRNLRLNQVFFDDLFNNAENRAYGGAEAIAMVLEVATAALAVAATPAAVSAALAPLATGALNIDYQSMSESDARDVLKTAASAAMSAAGSSSATAVIELIKAANSNYKASSAAIVEKDALAELFQDGPTVRLSAAETASFLATLKDGNVDPSLSGKEMDFVRAKTGPLVSGSSLYIVRTPGSSMYEYTNMIHGAWYNLVLSSELVGGVVTLTGTEVLSQMKYEDDKLYFRASNSATSAEVPLKGYYTIVRGKKTHRFQHLATGSVWTASSGWIPCIPAGQRVLTAAGWRAVEELRNGDMVVTDAGVAVPAEIHTSTVTTCSKTAPINLPVSMFGKTGNSFVRLSPIHAVRLRKNIWEFPCNLLLDGRAGVTQDAPGQKIVYYHIALPNYLRDNLVLEGGVVAESYGTPFAKANNLQGAKFYTYNKRLGGYTRMSAGAVSEKSKSA